MFQRFLALVGAVCLLAWIQVVLIHSAIDRGWLLPSREPDRTLGLAELLHYTALLILGLPAAVLLARSVSGPPFHALARRLERAGLWLPAAWGTLAAFCVSRWITHGAWFTDDEQAYLFQMKCYLDGRLTIPALQPEATFHHPFVVVGKVVDGTEWWAGTYPVMQPVMMALSSLLGSPLLSQWLCVGAIAYHSGRLTETMTGERRLGVCAAWLCSTSPMLVGLGATYHTSVLACLLSLLSVRACIGASATPSLARGALTGALAGATFLTRGLEGALIVVVTGLVLLWNLRATRRALLVTLAGFALAGAVAGAIYLYVNYATTGNPLETTYDIWSRKHGRIMGFSEDHSMMWHRMHTVPHGFSQTLTTLTRINVWAFGWPCSLLVALLCLLRPLHVRGAAWLLLLSAAQLFGYFFLAWGSVHDFGAAYHVWHVPFLAVAAAAVAAPARQFGVHLPRLMLGLTVVSALVFWPTQLEKWHTVANITLAPIRAAEAASQGRRTLVLWTKLRHRRAFENWVFRPPT
ncbi:MAG TPA: hypothetical protein VFZ61_34385, partial [Polyangiales bacterium]